MGKKFVLGIDNGGTVIKAALYDGHGVVHALAQSHMDTLVPQPLFTERDCEELWQANIRAIRRCIDRVGGRSGGYRRNRDHGPR